MGIKAGRLVQVTVRVYGNSPLIASVYPAKCKAKGFLAADEEEILNRRECVKE